jgi:Peptidase C13 family
MIGAGAGMHRQAMIERTGTLGLVALLATAAAVGSMLSGCSGGPPAAAHPDAARALVVGTGADPGEPRHVADALLQYRLLRSRGLSDAEIVLALPAWTLDGPGGRPVVRARVGGPDLLAGATVDLGVSELDPARIAERLDAGGGSLQAYVYLSGHGDETGIRLADDRPEPLSGGQLAAALKSLRASHDGDATLTTVVEDCEPDSFLDALSGQPGATVLTAAARGESSFATEYDRRTGTWLADRFTTELTRLLGGEQPTDAGRLLKLLRESVPDSRPQLAGEQGLPVDRLVPGA